jgi:hypothetical protein
MSDQAMSGRRDTETTQGRRNDLLSKCASFGLLFATLGVGFLAGLKACPPCPK